MVRLVVGVMVVIILRRLYAQEVGQVLPPLFLRRSSVTGSGLRRRRRVGVHRIGYVAALQREIAGDRSRSTAPMTLPHKQSEL